MKKLGQFEIGKVHCIDCMDGIARLGGEMVGAVVTDPPYGIGVHSMQMGKWRTSKMDVPAWDTESPDLEPILSLGVKSIIWGGNHHKLPPSRMFLVWDKGAGFKGRSYAECEVAWCSWGGSARVMRHDPLANGDYRDKVHPTQKPVRIMEWCLSFVGGLVLDPFAGSGSTGVACARLGIPFVGFEINQGYCDAANARIEATRKGVTVDELKHGQETLFYVTGDQDKEGS